ncbi:MAG: DsrE family protein [Gemmatimonadota bacterium]
MTRRLSVLLALVLCSAGALRAQASSLQMSGPLIQSGGPSFQVPDATFPIPKGHVFRVMWALNQHADSSQSNAQMATIARFFNLHARHGIPKENRRAAAVVNGNAWMALLTDEAYQRRYGRPNPSKALVQELLAHGTRFAVCGQTALSMGVRSEELLPGVQLAISAMTALNVFYADGYRLQTWQ